MPLNLSKVGKILKTLNRVDLPTEFNATLPIKIEVKKQLSPIRYLIQLGKKEVQTKSYTPLIVGKKYFAQIKEKKGVIQITNLKEFPKILEDLEKIDVKEFKEKDILKHLANSNSKNEFIFWTNILLAYKNKIHHLIINEKRKAIMQFKHSKNRVKFYSVFSHLGEIEGEISEEFLIISSNYESTLKLIDTYKEELNLKIILKKEEAKPLFNFSENLLNLKA
jgi:hypothetical protein